MKNRFSDFAVQSPFPVSGGGDFFWVFPCLYIETFFMPSILPGTKNDSMISPKKGKDLSK